MKLLPTEWTRRIQNVFADVNEDLATVLDAACCRELWLQGEFYRRLRRLDSGFEVNKMHAGVKVDLLGSSPRSMIAEVKVFGVCGYGANCHKNMESIKRDSARLRKIQGSKQAADEAYQVLVLQTIGELDIFGRAVMDHCINTPEYPRLAFNRFIVRIWSFPPRSRTTG